jgi:hypothetical protein
VRFGAISAKGAARAEADLKKAKAGAARRSLSFTQFFGDGGQRERIDPGAHTAGHRQRNVLVAGGARAVTRSWRSPISRLFGFSQICTSRTSGS